MTDIPKAYEAVATVGAFIIARKRAGGLYHVFDGEGGIDLENCFTTLERARAYVPTIDHMTRFSSNLAGVRYRRCAA